MPGQANPQTRPLETIWEMPNELWERFEQILLERYPPAPVGRHRVDLRPVVDGVIYRMRSGCQWNHLPERFGDDSTVHRWFQRWVGDGVLAELWALLASECEELGGLDWRWQAADCCLGKARSGGGKRAAIPLIEPNPGPRRACLSSARAVPSG